MSSRQEIYIDSKRKSIFSLFKEMVAYKDLLYFLFRRDFISTYKQSVFGVIWFFVQPLSLCVVYYFLFSKVAKLEVGNINPLVFYLSGVIFWTFFSEGTTKVSNTLIMNADLFRKVYFPRLISPLSNLGTVYVKIIFQTVILLGMFIYFRTKGDVNVTFNIFKLVAGVGLLTLLSLGVGLIVASFSIKYKDVKFMLEYMIQLLMYLTTVAYSYINLPYKLQRLMFYNPISHILEFVRSGLGTGYSYDPNGLIYTVGVSLVLLLIGVSSFNRVQGNFVDQI